MSRDNDVDIQVSKNSTVRKNDYNIVTNPKENESVEFEQNSRHERALSGTQIFKLSSPLPMTIF